MATLAQTILGFYGPAVWGTQWGVVDKDHPTGHHGFDLKHPAGTAIPALRAGSVVMSYHSSVLGDCWVVQVAPGDYDGYAHTKDTAVQIGYRVSQGDTIAHVAGYGDFHGTSWTGPHTHLTNSPGTSGVLGVGTRNPKPVIESVLASFGGTAGDGSSPLDGGSSAAAGPTPSEILERTDPNMPTILHAASGTMALVVPLGSRVYTNPNDFSYQANAGTYPRLECATDDILNTLVGEQNERDAVLIARIVQAAAVAGGGQPLDSAALEAAVKASAEAGAEDAVRKVLGSLDGATPTTAQ